MMPHAYVQETPDSPAWFALDSTFSAHAGGRFGGAATHFHHYEVREALDLVVFEHFDDMSEFLTLNQRNPGLLNDKAAALAIQDVLPRIDGYVLEADMVRGDAEIVLFDLGLRKLTKRFVASMEAMVRPIVDVSDPAAGDLAAPRSKRTLRGIGGQAVYQSEVGTLEFQVAGQKGRKKRSLSQ